MKPFLSAYWKNLLMINYPVPPEVLVPYLPKGTTLDFFEETCYMSVVGFLFQDTKIKGLHIPLHKHFEEVNLRFYVTHKSNGQTKRGVVFISEIVPKPAICWVANTLYKEHYSYMPMHHKIEALKNSQNIAYAFKQKNHWHRLAVCAATDTMPLQANSLESFIAEHYWGYAKYNEHTTYEYEVQHPSWRLHPIQSYRIDCDFECLYGARLAAYLQNPTNVLLAEGSAVTVGHKKVLKF